ncbi:MAG: hypothetical protein JJT94_05755 [Bernardetiaceae bacterium]|nr:hypothetical protein [Bernardetiaceae bacterium]
MRRFTLTFFGLLALAFVFIFVEYTQFFRFVNQTALYTSAMGGAFLAWLILQLVPSFRRAYPLRLRILLLLPFYGLMLPSLTFTSRMLAQKPTADMFLLAEKNIVSEKLIDVDYIELYQIREKQHPLRHRMPIHKPMNDTIYNGAILRLAKQESLLFDYYQANLEKRYLAFMEIKIKNKNLNLVNQGDIDMLQALSGGNFYSSKKMRHIRYNPEKEKYEARLYVENPNNEFVDSGIILEGTINYENGLIMSLDWSSIKQNTGT